MVVTLTGENSHELRAELSKIITEFTAEYGDIAVEQIDGEDASVEHIFSAVQNPSFLSSRKLVVIDNFTSQKAVTDSLGAMLDGVIESNDVVFVAQKIDNRASYAGLLKKRTDFRQFSAKKGQEIVSWIVSEVEHRGGKIDLSCARYLSEYVGTDEQRLSNEIDKLILYNQHVTRDSIELMCEREPSSSVFELLDAAFSGNIKRALALYEEQRQQQVEPLYILSMIAWQLQILALVKTAPTVKTIDDIARDSGMHRFVVQKASAAVGHISKSDLRTLVREALKLEVRCKSQKIDADDALRHYLVSVGV